MKPYSNGTYRTLCDALADLYVKIRIRKKEVIPSTDRHLQPKPVQKGKGNHR